MRNQKKFQKFAIAFVFLFSVISTVLMAQAPKPPASQDAAMTPGLIVLTGFEGDVKIATAQNPEGQRPSSGAKLQKGDIILTGPNSTASLAFSNGSVLQVQSDSKFSIEEYLQKPWDFDEAAFKKLEKEPTSSQTKLKLDYGDVICNVKKLSSASEMTVSTPLGVAGIRGTTFKLSVRLDSKGKPQNSKLSVVEGAVAFSKPGESKPPIVTGGSVSTMTLTPSADRSGGQEVTVVFNSQLSPKDSMEIMRVVTQIVQQVGEFVMSAITAQEELKKKEEEKKSEKGERKAGDGEKKEGDQEKSQIDLSKLSPPQTGGEKAAEKAAVNAAAAKAQAEAEAKATPTPKTTPTLTGFSLSATSATYGDATLSIIPPTSASSGVISYTSSDKSVATVSGTRITIVGVGTTTITASQVADGNYNAATPVSLSLTVSKKALTISGVSATNRVYDGTTAVALTGGALVGVENGDAVTLGGTPAGTVASAGVGTGKAVTVAGYALSGGDAANYSLTQPSGVTVDISPALVTVTAASANKTYGESDPAFSYTSNPTALIAGNSFTGSLSRVTGEDPGTYAINQGTLSAGDNYTITFQGANFTINTAGGQSPNLTGFGLHEQKVASNGVRTVKIIAPQSNSPAQITYRCDPQDNASISGSIITLIDSPVRIYAEQAASGGYTSASVSINLTWVSTTRPEDKISNP